MAFIDEIPVVTDFNDVLQLDQHRKIPGDWHVYVADVRGSTSAIEAGRYKDVNIVGACSILAVCNAVAPDKVLYSFGGDGATIVAPPVLNEKVMNALLGVQELSAKSFQLELSVGSLKVSELESKGARIAAVRLKQGAAEPLAQISGDGIALAEKLIKERSRTQRIEPTKKEIPQPNLEGFECRWQPVETTKDYTVTVIAMSLKPADGAFYRRLIKLFQNSAPKPSFTDTLSLGNAPKTFWGETKARAGTAYAKRIYYLVKIFLLTLLFKLLYATFLKKFADRYVKELIEQSDYRKFDGFLRAVVDMSDDNLRALEAFLESEYKAKNAVYGIHLSKSALLTCLIFDRFNGNHIHFVDGSDGGYALAAKAMKARLKAI